MSKFNSPAVTRQKTVNLAGGSAYKMTPELELVSALLTSFLEDKYYQSGKERQKQIVTAANAVDAGFAARAAIYARKEFGMRSTSHVVAAAIADKLAGTDYGARFFTKIVNRPDDITEILSLYKSQSGKRETHAMRKGFAVALSNFDAYQLGKYRGVGKSMKLVDSVNITHPAHTEQLKALVDDTLRSTNTFQNKISEAGKSDKPEAKKEAWAELVNSGKLGYFALLRNLRNIIEQSPEVLDAALAQLTNAKQIKQSLVLPFRFLTASEEIEKLPGREAKQVLQALSTALDISCENIPKFEGETLVAIDKSGSMGGDPIRKSALFGAMIVKSNLADVMLWDNNTQMLSCNPSDSVITIAKTILSNCRNMGGTNIACLFREATRAYSRILILTDEQSWGHSYYGGYGMATQELAAYNQRVGAQPFVYNWDMQGYGSLQFPERQVATLAGWSDKCFDIMKLVETDKQALVNTIKAVEI